MDHKEPTGPEVLRRIAQALDLPVDDVLGALGGGWRPIELGVGEVHLRRPSADWFVSGEPMQVLLGVAGPTLTLARIVLRWDGPGTESIDATEQREFAREDVIFQPGLVADAIEELARRSRRSFRWCRTCRTLSRPEHMNDRVDCMACAATYRHVVY
jgi:hypothetical protein